VSLPGYPWAATSPHRDALDQIFDKALSPMPEEVPSTIDSDFSRSIHCRLELCMALNGLKFRHLFQAFRVYNFRHQSLP